MDVPNLIALLLSALGIGMAVYALRHGQTESRQIMHELREEIDRLRLRVRVLETAGKLQEAVAAVNARLMRAANIEPITPDIFRETQQQIADGISKNANGMVAKMRTAFDLDELKSLAFDMNFHADQIKGDQRNRYAEELVMLCERNGRLSELARLVVQQRPNLWRDE